MPFTIVIDAGHGGKDPGALGSIVREKDLVLDVALRFGKLIDNNYPEVNVIYTRSSDVFIPLEKRASIANKSKANLFVSIHADWAENKSVRGASTFTLGQNRTRENFEIAKRENSVILLEDDYKTRYEGFDPNSAESYIMFEFMQDNYMNQSIKFASTLQERFVQSGRVDRGVRQDVFLVLRNTSMPSVLVELGFLTNKEEELFLKSDAGRDQMARTMLKAFSDFREDYERKSGIRQTSTQKSDKRDTAQTRTVKSDTSKMSAASSEKDDTSKRSISKSANNDTSRITSSKSTKTEKKISERLTEGIITFKIQTLMSSYKLSDKDKRFKGYKMDYYTEKGFYKYTYGNYSSFDEANKGLKGLTKYFPDAFVVSFKDGHRMALNDARKETSR
jgi:N-acetylmuramoyl-L-alanine amidase